LQLKKIRGKLFYLPQNGLLEVVATGRADWVGWFELRREDITWAATYNTGRVIASIKPDILIVIEVEDRPTLQRFNTQVLKTQFNFSYPHFMLIDGNDMRGIDIGIFSRFPITEIRSHVDDRDLNNLPVFSRDCPEYDIEMSGGERMVIIPSHFKSKRNGNDTASQKKRKAQADRAHAVCLSALNRSPFVLLGGDLNDTPDSAPLTSLFTDGFRDINIHPHYPADRPGTFETGIAGNKIDYLIMSPKLQEKLIDAGIERRGSYHPNTWVPFDTVTSKTNEASDHHLIWADFDLN
jgi:endonuclease/exonuclease/phosphatase family metal-dependent hydrolase